MTSRKRRKFFVDARTQGALLLRIAAYWTACVILIGGMIFAVTFLTRRELPLEVAFNQTLLQFAPALVASVLVLPVMLLDFLRFSHRLVGPIARLRRSWRKLADGKDVANIRFRDRDFWFELADEFNRVNELVHKLRRQNASLLRDYQVNDAIQQNDYPQSSCDSAERHQEETTVA